MRIASTVGTIASGGGTPTLFDFYIGPNALPANDPPDPTVNPSGTGTNTGTISAPWSINAFNNKSCRQGLNGVPAGGYRGKRIGMLDGVYAVYNTVMAATGTLPIVIFNIEGGTAASSTIVSAVNSRKAIIDAHQIPGQFGSGYALRGCEIIGQLYAQSPFITQIGYLEIHGLVVTGMGYLGTSPPGGPVGGILMYGTKTVNPGTNQGYVVQDCEVYDMHSLSTATLHGNNGCIYLQSALNAVVRNNLIHDMTIEGAGAPAGGCALFQFQSVNTLYEHNTVYNMTGNAIYCKDAENNSPTIRYNYFETYNTGLEDTTAGDLGATVNVYNNIFYLPNGGIVWDGQCLGVGTVNGVNYAHGFVNSINFYNNTVFIGGTNQFAGTVFTGPIGTLSSPSGSMNQWNNLVVSSGGYNVQLTPLFGVEYIATGAG